MKKQNLKQYYIELFNLNHYNIYDYSKSEILSSSSKIEVICKNHGSFFVTPNNHLNKKSGCPKCKNTNKEFFNKVKLLFNNKYDYSESIYINSRSKIKVICNIHGYFDIIAQNHLLGWGCNKCLENKKSELLKIDLLNRMSIIHNNKYEYEFPKIVKSYSIIKIKCPVHNWYNQSINCHLYKECGCPKCNISKGELYINKLLKNNNIEFLYKVKNGLKNIKELEFDFYLPNNNLYIEYNGRQHYESIEYFGGDKQLNKQIENDNLKINWCKLYNYELLIIKYNENIEKKLEFLWKKSGS